MLAALVERILPEGFFSPTLLPSRACPLVLLDYVQEGMPKLAAHLFELGIDLPAICFSWFLSLFTDCLPVEVRRRFRCVMCPTLSLSDHGVFVFVFLFFVFRRCSACGTFCSLMDWTSCFALRWACSGVMRRSSFAVTRSLPCTSRSRACRHGCGSQTSSYR